MLIIWGVFILLNLGYQLRSFLNLIRFLTKNTVARLFAYLILLVLALLYYYEVFVMLSYAWGLPALLMTD